MNTIDQKITANSDEAKGRITLFANKVEVYQTISRFITEGPTEFFVTGNPLVDHVVTAQDLMGQLVAPNIAALMDLRSDNACALPENNSLNPNVFT